jgi:hypothetical protein
MISDAIWDNPEKTIIRQIYAKGYQRDDAKRVIAKTHDMIASVEHQVHVVMDFRDSQQDNPARLAGLTKFIESMVHDRQDQLFVVAANRYLKLLIQYNTLIAPRASQNRYLVDTMDEVYEKLEALGKSVGKNPNATDDPNATDMDNTAGNERELE